MKAVKFKNFTKEDFTYSFDGTPYTFKAGAEMFLEDYKAEHFAKHLVDRELNRARIPTNNKVERAKLETQCFPQDEESVTPIEALNINEGKKRNKKTEKVAKEEFPDLKK